ncbi:hypothetical protein PPL_07155 [Heterostelium album PN500]|uniref:Uncharacterized protein n=1 Tax=Heterostelium pallidum (strain ATCC 26659 / Pp 5 / PN500) TaxID=670386 RepID=D3BEJ3_HETP5|nr:hypothetical protein PPL_07155 [Heterostelium album PN500]EFA80324.1 hypothetical protein PPL_07155 [Heterostelium album PN500]|eukprot:XP_020432444.1 hypothetical protein PPL_07155 [Heterostelium album PN500]
MWSHTSIITLLLNGVQSYDNYLMSQSFLDATTGCSGSVLSTSFYKTNVCFNSQFVTCSTADGVATLTGYTNPDCTGRITTLEKYQLQCDEASGYQFSCQNEVYPIHNTVGAYNYYDTNDCDTEPFFAQMSITNTCQYGAIIQCTNSTMTTTSFQQLDCTFEISKSTVNLNTNCIKNANFQSSKNVCF